MPPHDLSVAGAIPEASSIRCAPNPAMLTPSSNAVASRNGARFARSSAKLVTPKLASMANTSRSSCGSVASARSRPTSPRRQIPRPSKIVRAKPAGTNKAVCTSPSSTAVIASVPPRPAQVANLEPAGDRRHSSAPIQPQIRCRLAIPQSPIMCSVIGCSSRASIFGPLTGVAVGSRLRLVDIYRNAIA